MSRALRLLVACLTHLFRRSSLLAEQSTAKNAVLLGFFDFILPSRRREAMTDPEEKFHPDEMTEQERDAAWEGDDAALEKWANLHGWRLIVFTKTLLDWFTKTLWLSGISTSWVTSC
jgi:hypothetical protein